MPLNANMGNPTDQRCVEMAFFTIARIALASTGIVPYKESAELPSIALVIFEVTCITWFCDDLTDLGAGG